MTGEANISAFDIEESSFSARPEAADATTLTTAASMPSTPGAAGRPAKFSRSATLTSQTLNNVMLWDDG